jgi:hypothetical protein
MHVGSTESHLRDVFDRFRARRLDLGLVYRALVGEVTSGVVVSWCLFGGDDRVDYQ